MQYNLLSYQKTYKNQSGLIAKELFKMKTLQFKIDINAPVNKVYDYMLGLSDKATYNAWTAVFNPTSTFEGDWARGEKIYFIGLDQNGQRGGMVSMIAEHIPSRFVSIKHLGILAGDTEILEGPDVEKWAGGTENYTFQEHNGTTTVIVDLDTSEDFSSHMEDIYPQSLQKLKQICEK